MSTVAGEKVTVEQVGDAFDGAESHRVTCTRCRAEWLFSGERWAAQAAEEHRQVECQPVTRHEPWCTDHFAPFHDTDGFCERRWQTSSGVTVELSRLFPDGPLTIEVPDTPSMDAGEARALAALLIEAAELVERSA